MTQEIESVKPALSVVLDDGDFIINSTGAIGKAMAQAILPLAAAAKRVTVISDGEMRVMKRNGPGAESDLMAKGAASAERARKALVFNEDPDIQDQFAADLESGVTGEQAT